MLKFEIKVTSILKELDDRGLLDGGVAVPSYYTSLRQRSRRHLEMRHRSSRLQDRENHAVRSIFIQ